MCSEIAELTSELPSRTNSVKRADAKTTAHFLL